MIDYNQLPPLYRQVLDWFKKNKTADPSQVQAAFCLSDDAALHICNALAGWGTLEKDGAGFKYQASYHCGDSPSQR